MFQHEVVYQSKRSRARVCRITTAHGVIETPEFVPVATQGAIKSVDALLANGIELPLVFCNTYHLMLHPGAETVARLGGLHAFMKRDRPLITDSGGFQVFSLAYGGVHEELKSCGAKKSHGSVLKISEEGVTFRSYRDGSSLLLTPESSVQAQKNLGADIILPLDELPPYHTDPARLRTSLDRTHRWELRSLQEHLRDRRHQAMYGIIHGGIDPELRALSARTIAALPFDGSAIGGSIGKNRQEMHQMLLQLMPHLPYDRPIHLLGIADIPSIDDSIPLGIDTFDSCYPSRVARHGLLFARSGHVKILQTRHREDTAPIDAECSCVVCQTHTRAYIHHLFKAHEASAWTLATIHNLTYMRDLMARYRERILQGEL